MEFLTKLLENFKTNFKSNKAFRIIALVVGLFHLGWFLLSLLYLDIISLIIVVVSFVISTYFYNWIFELINSKIKKDKGEQ